MVILPDGGRGYLSKIFSDGWMASYGFLSRDGEATVGEVLRSKSGQLPALVHTHPNETVRDAVEIMHEYGVSQMPVVSAEPPVMAGEVVGSVSERDLLDALFAGTASLADAVSGHMAEPFAAGRVRREPGRGAGGAAGPRRHHGGRRRQAGRRADQGRPARVPGRLSRPAESRAASGG